MTTISQMPLGRNNPSTFDHVEQHPVTAEQLVTPKIQPVAPGLNWYTSFDAPVKQSDGSYRLPEKNLGTIRGGHCICLCPPSLLSKDTDANWQFFNQGQEGACEGFGHSRRFALLYGRHFDAFHLYDDAQREEGTYQPNGGSAENGTTNEAICKALAQWGVHEQTGAEAHRAPVSGERTVKKVSSYTWATSADQVLAVLGITDGGLMPLLNSWGEQYPHVVGMPPETLDRLLREGGECDVLVDVA